MKKFLAIFLVLSLIAALAACGAKTENEPTDENTEAPTDEVIGTEQLAGGFSIINPEKGAELPENVQKAFTLALDGLTGASYTPVAYLASQVVAGANYAVLCASKPVVPNAVPTLKVVVIYNDLDGNAEILRINDFDLGKYLSASDEEAPADEPGLAGGWTVNTEFPEANLDEGAKAACDAVLQGVMGVEYQPIACLATQVVAGINYAVLCKATVSADEGNTNQLRIVTIYAGLDNNYEVLNTATLNLAEVCGAQDVEE